MTVQPSAYLAGRTVAAPMPVGTLASPRPSAQPVAALRYGSRVGAGIDRVVAENSVSSLHAQILFDGRSFVLQDLGALNGTWFGGREVVGTALQLGDRFHLGRAELTFGPAEAGELTQRWQALAGTQDTVGATVSVALTRFGVDQKVDVRVVGGGQWFEIGPAGGAVLFGSARVSVGPRWLRQEDVLHIGSQSVAIRHMLEEALPRLVIDQGRRQMRIGRAAASDFVVSDTSASSEHCVITRRNSGLFEIRDGSFDSNAPRPSTNGTWINGKAVRVNAPVALAHGDILGVGAALFRVHVQGMPSHSRAGLRLSAQGASIRGVDDRTGQSITFLHPTFLTLNAGELVGMLGPSGSGKSTLSTALVGLNPPNNGGAVSVGGISLYAAGDAAHGLIGYVPQDDLVHGELTVHEALYFNARLRLPPTVSHTEVGTRVSHVLRRLGLLEKEHQRVGDVNTRGLSGGQRKRVNVGLELIVDPPVLVLDEATSGLSSDDAARLLELLRELADDGRVVLLTLHAPELDSYKLFDHVVYLVRGKVVYFGPAFPNSILHFYPEATNEESRKGPLSSAGMALKAIGKATDGLDAATEAQVIDRMVDRYRSTPEYAELVAGRDADVRSDQSARARVSPIRGPGFAAQTYWLLRRATVIKTRDKGALMLMVVQPLCIIAAIACFGPQDLIEESVGSKSAVLFLLVVAAHWLGCSNAIREFVGEAPIFKRERNVGVSTGAYVLSKLILMYAITTVQVVAMAVCAAALTQLDGSLALLVFFLLGTGFSGVGIALTISAMSRTAAAANAWLPLVLIPQVILAGAILPLDTSPATALASAIWPVRWGLEGALLAEHDGLQTVTDVRDACYGGEIDCLWMSDEAGSRVGMPVRSGCVAGDDTVKADPNCCIRTQVNPLDGSTRCAEPRIIATSDPVCASFCNALEQGSDITAFDRIYGPSPRERQEAGAPASADMTNQRTGFAAAMVGTWGLAVMAALAALAARRRT